MEKLKKAEAVSVAVTLAVSQENVRKRDEIIAIKDEIIRRV